MTRQADSLIRLDHVSKSFGRRAVLEDVSFEVSAGEAFCILGKSGTGKSVTLKLMIGLLASDRGSIVIDGAELKALDRRSTAGSPQEDWIHVSGRRSVRLDSAE